MDEEITCEACDARCCRLEVRLMGDDSVPERFVRVDQWGVHVMARSDDGLCAALDRKTHMCSIYERRPGLCREFPTGGDDCKFERARFPVFVIAKAKP